MVDTLEPARLARALLLGPTCNSPMGWVSAFRRGHDTSRECVPPRRSVREARAALGTTRRSTTSSPGASKSAPRGPDGAARTLPRGSRARPLKAQDSPRASGVGGAAHGAAIIGAIVLLLIYRAIRSGDPRKNGLLKVAKRRAAVAARRPSVFELVFPGLLRPGLHLIDEDLATRDLGRIRKDLLELLVA